MNRFKKISTLSLFAGAGVVLLFTLSSCAYFNTLYNARRLYKEAEEERSKTDSQREVSSKYKEVVKKCAQLVSNYPKSRYVDDAVFLMGQALVREGEYDKGIRKFFELKTNFPKSKYVPRALYWMALAYYEKKDFSQAYSSVEKFLTTYPKNKLRFKVMFLAGDIARELEENEEALNFYSKVVEEASDRELVNEAVLRSANLFFDLEEYDKAAANYEKLLRKGISWEDRYKISLSLGKCYTAIGKCKEAENLYNELLAKVISIKEKPALRLGLASSYECMDSLKSALKVYDSVTKEFPKSLYSAEAYYREGIIYHEKLDSLERAQKAFEMAPKEAPSSDFASIALQKANSLKRLMELEKSRTGKQSREQIAERRFYAAEIQLTKLDEVEHALANYKAVIDTFSDTPYAPKAAYAVGWVYVNKLKDTTAAVSQFADLVKMFPRTQQALGAVEEIKALGYEGLGDSLASFVDSVLADTTGSAAGAAAERRRTGTPVKGTEGTADSLKCIGGAADSSSAAPDTTDLSKAGGRRDSTAITGGND